MALEAGKDVPRSYGSGNWIGMDFYGIDHLLAPTYARHGDPRRETGDRGLVRLQRMVAEGDNAAILEKYLEKWSLSVQ